MLFMVIERFRDRCFQLMECTDARLLQQWVAAWGDLIDFEIVPVVPSIAARVRAEGTTGTIEPLL